MNHRWVERRLSEFAAGELPAVLHARVRSHVESCEECRAWLETLAFFRDALGSGGASASPGHPSSAELAEWAVGRRDVPAGAQRHLESCPECHRALTLTRQATRTAGRDESSRRGWVSATERPFLRRLAAAAGIALVLLAGGLLLRRSGPGESNYRVPAGYLVGEQVIDFPGSIEAAGVQIDSGSSISFKARESVVLGEGFVVAQDASLTVEVTEPPADRQNG